MNICNVAVMESGELVMILGQDVLSETGNQMLRRTGTRSEGGRAYVQVEAGKPGSGIWYSIWLYMSDDPTPD